MNSNLDDKISSILDPDLLLSSERLEESSKTYTNVAWQNYYYLLIKNGTYGNWFQSLLIPTSVFTSTNTNRCPTYFHPDNVSNATNIKIYQNGNNSVIIETNKPNQGYEVAIYGIGKK